MVQRIQVQTEDNMISKITHESTAEEVLEKVKFDFLMSKDEVAAKAIEEHKKFQEMLDAE